jgi:hypothetical protein
MIYEAKLKLNNGPEAIERSIDGLRTYCQEIFLQNGQYHLDFETSHAVVRSHDDGLLIRVEADDFAVCDGTKALILSQLSQYASNMPVDVLWIVA